MGFFSFLFKEKEYPFYSYYVEDFPVQDVIDFRSEGFYFNSWHNDGFVEIMCTSIAKEDNQEKVFKALMKEIERNNSSKNKFTNILNRKFSGADDKKFDFKRNGKWYFLLVTISHRNHDKR